MDRLTPDQRSWNMSRIRGHDTRPERTVRSLLHCRGFRFALRRSDLPGKPDIVLPRWRSVIFVHGCFWHRHDGCKNSVLPKTRPAFWSAKLAGNVARDAENVRRLVMLGWRVLIVWECELTEPEQVCNRLVAALVNDAD
jgi:DNA mismatch endonuclease, patch repair protein